jgi:tetratricopeptide (TPR) repeat protein
MDDDDEGDTHWMTLHVEHLLAFVDYVRKVIDAAPMIAGVPLEAQAERAELVWRNAVALADGAVNLTGTWQASALRGDTFASAASLLGTLSSRMKDPRLTLHTSEMAPPAPSPDGEWLDIEMPSYPAGKMLDEAEAVSCAEAAYKEAISCGGSHAIAEVGLSLGELYMNRARRLPEEEKASSLHCAGEAFQAVAMLKRNEADKDTTASAWYNLACVAGMLGKVEHAAEALTRCLEQVDASQRSRWISEALEDEDLLNICKHPLVQNILGNQ